MSYEPWPRLEKRTRLKIAALGALAWLAVLPAAFLALVSFGFHGSMDRVWGESVALYAVPLLLLLLVLLGFACFLCFSRRGLLVVKALAAASILDVLLLAAAAHSANQPRPSFARTYSPLPPPASGPVQVLPGPVQVGIACSATSDECWTIRSEDGKEVSRERSTGSGLEREKRVRAAPARDGSPPPGE